MNRKQRNKQLAARRQHTEEQNRKRLAGEKTAPRPRRKQPRKPKG